MHENNPEKNRTAHLHDVVVFTRRRGSAVLYRMGDFLQVPLPVAEGERPSKVPTVTDTPAPDTDRKPYITELVHYESFGHPTGEPKACRPAVVIEVHEDEELLLAVFRANGILFETCRHEEDTHLGGTWHYAHS